MSDLTRRTVLSGLAGVLATPFIQPSLVRAAEGEITIWGPPAGPSITLAHAIARGALSHVADKVTFKTWRSPDELRAGLTSKTMELVVLPTQLAANLYNRGLGTRLVNVMTNGLLYVVSADTGISSLPALKGRSIAVPFRNDTPDLLFRRLIGAYEMTPGEDFELRYTATPIEAIQLLATGRIDAALAPEPSASAAIVKASKGDARVTRVIDIQNVWGEVTGRPPVLPQAGLGVMPDFLENHGGVVEVLRGALVEATVSVNADPARAASDAASVLQMPWPILEKAIPHSNLVAISAREARPTLESMFGAVAEFDPKIIGGKLPPAEFYL